MKRTRLERAASLAAKRPAITVEVTHAPCPRAREELLDLLVELLDERAKDAR